MALLKTLFLLLLTTALGLSADDPAEADAAWTKLKGANSLPHLPGDWKTTPPTDQELVRKTLRAEVDRLIALAEVARGFAIKFPEDPRRSTALQLAEQALGSAEKIGSPTARQKLAELQKDRMADPKLTAKEKLAIRMAQVQAAAEALAPKSAKAARDKYEEETRKLIEEFPKEPGPWVMLMEVIDQGNEIHTLEKLQQVVKSDAPGPIKDRAAAILHRYETLGKTLTMKFTALGGGEVDLEKLRGKVVVIHFWATWCDTCVDAIVTMSKAYPALKELGVELIGISVDSDKAKVDQFVREKAVTWPQFYEPAGRTNHIVREWGVTAIPSMWLIDRNGILRDLDAQTDMSKKIEKLLAEPPETK